MKYQNIREETLKNKVSQDYFGKFDCTEVIRDIDFAVKAPFYPPKGGEKPPLRGEIEGAVYLLWAEAKQKSTDVLVMLTQLVLTIGKARTFDKILPPPFLGCFDCEKIAFVPYADIQDIFYQNDFNWKVAPSDNATREFKQIYAQLEKIIYSNVPWETFLFDFEKDEKDLKRFIRQNFDNKGIHPLVTKIRIDKNNFITIYNKWLETVKPTIQVDDWNLAKKNGIIDGDFYLADLIAAENKTLKEKLFVLLKINYYELDRKWDASGFLNFSTTAFSDNQKAHAQFWAKYDRPPLEEYWDYIIERRDLLVPQDVRERKGSFFTPRIWVELSQRYITDVLGKDWQDEYYVWDCAAGTGNLLAGLNNKYNIYASTIDKADVAVMHDRIKNGASLLEHHVFQFDFLNDDFEKLPEGLRKIIKNEPEKLIIYINPPYAEATSSITKTGFSRHKSGVSIGNKTYIKYSTKMGKARNELYTQFLIRIFNEIHGCKIGEFSKLKALVAPNFSVFRKNMTAKLLKCFIVPANTFDNVKGKFPIGFKIWDTNNKEHFQSTIVDVYDHYGTNLGLKTYTDGSECKYINDWMKQYRDKSESFIGNLCYVGNDFQQQNVILIYSPLQKIISHYVVFKITQNNLLPASVYYSVRKVISATWLNDRDQFLYPNDGWKDDIEFQTDCLTYTLFHGSNNIQSKYGVNHWIPFTENDINARTKFDSSFMTDFMTGKIIASSNVVTPLFFDMEQDRFDETRNYGPKLQFSDRALEVFKAGKELWKYYHSQKHCNVNASFYDIREYFQSRDATGRMKNTSDDERYNMLMNNLKLEMKFLAPQIEQKIYKYGFLSK